VAKKVAGGHSILQAQRKETGTTRTMKALDRGRSKRVGKGVLAAGRQVLKSGYGKGFDKYKHALSLKRYHADWGGQPVNVLPAAIPYCDRLRDEP
jgi:hypothetical protein